MILNEQWFINAYNFAVDIARRGNCLKRNYGCVIVNTKGEITSFGYTHHDDNHKTCRRRFARKGHGYDRCTTIHAEQMAVAGVPVEKGSLAVLACVDGKTKSIVKYPRPCATCARILKSAGVRSFVTTSGVHTL